MNSSVPTADASHPTGSVTMIMIVEIILMNKIAVCNTLSYFDNLHDKLNFDWFLTLYPLTSVSTFSILFTIHFPRC